jgi:hypothetical protein
MTGVSGTGSIRWHLTLVPVVSSETNLTAKSRFAAPLKFHREHTNGFSITAVDNP